MGSPDWLGPGEGIVDHCIRSRCQPWNIPVWFHEDVVLLGFFCCCCLFFSTSLFFGAIICSTLDSDDRKFLVGVLAHEYK